MTDEIVPLLDALATLDIRLRVIDGHLGYDAPPGVFTEALKARVRALRPALIEYLSATAPLSCGQERMWFLNRLDGAHAAYTEHLAYDMTGPLDPAALAGAIDFITARHAVLRTRFRDGPDGPEQVITTERPVLEVVDLDGLTDAAVAERLGAAARRTFDLGVEAPVHFTLFGLGRDRYVLSVAAHHAAWDGWSNGIFAVELAAAYAAVRDGVAPALSPLATDIATLARAERGRLAQDPPAPALERLRRACAGFATLLPLPLDRPRAPVADGIGGVLPVRIEAAAVAALTSAGRNRSATPYMVLLAAWALLLARLTGLRRLLIGAPVAGRHGPDEEALIGYLSNTIVFPIDLDGVESFGDLVGRARDAVLAGIAGQEVPFDLLVEALAPLRSTATTPLVQSVFALQPAPIAAPAIEGVTVTVLPEGEAAARYELMLNLAPTADGGLEGRLVYAMALFDRTTVAGWLDDFQAIVRAAPESWIAPLDLAPLPRIPVLEPAATAGVPLPRLPLTDIEQRLADIWREFLTVDSITRDDDFFLLGGHSLLLMRMLNRVVQSGLGRIALGDALSRTKLGAMAALLDGGPSERPVAPTPQIDPAEEAPASLAQEGLWLARQDEPQTSTWVVPLFLPLDPAEDPDAVRRALDQLAARHPALRTTIGVRDGHVLQRIAPPAPIVLEIHRGLDRAARAERMRQELARPFDLERGPLYRFHLFQGAEIGGLFVVADHIVTDGWSQDVLARDFRAFLAAETTGGDPALPTLVATPALLAAQTRAALAGARGDALRDYWLGALQDMTLGAPPAALGRRPPTAARRGRRTLLPLAPGAHAALDRIAKTGGVTQTAALVAGIAALIVRLKGDGRDVSVAMPFACRTAPEQADLIGCFADLLPIRLAGTLIRPFADLLAATREAIAQALVHQDYPLCRLIADVNRTHGGEAGPLFDAVVVLEDAPSNLRDWFAPTIGAGKYDLAFIADRLPDGGALLTIEYDEWLYGEADALAFAARLETLLCDAAARPQAELGDLALLPEAERRLVVEDFNRTAAPYPRDRDLAALWRDAAGRFCDHIALVGVDGVQVTYAELDRRASRLAAVLDGPARGDRTVALAAERGVEAIVVILAVLKLGAAYLPIDGKLPPAMVGRLMADAGARLILADARAAERLAGLNGVTLLQLDGIAPPPEPVVFEDRPGDGGAPAYVMFTSGSTGEPKGVIVPHRAVARLALDRNLLPIGPGDGVPQAAPLGFDAATLEIWGALLNGARLVLLDDEALMEPEALGRALARTGATVMWLTAGLFNRVADAQPAAFAPLRLLMTGGEVLSPSHLRRVMAACPDLRLVNGYGPTENTTFTATHSIRPVDLEDAVPIGRPVANSRVLVLDERLYPVPVGVWGELVCAGDGLALGYANRPDLTAVAFVTLPWRDGERVYRTGDRARWRHDGVLEFGGRSDGQIKIRGHRIETTAIETVLRQYPGIRDAAVLVTGEGAEKLLVACLVADDPAAETAWRLHLAERLPSYMMPARFVPLPGLPVTANGKCDRRTLQRFIATASTPVPTATTAASTARERLVIRLFAEFFAGAVIDRTTDFLRLGGHSLLVMRLAARIAEETGCRLNMRALFAARTVAAIAALLPETDKPAASETVSVAGVREDHPLSPSQERLVVMQRLFPDSGVYNVPIAFDLEGGLDVAALDRTFVALETRHHALRLRVLDRGDGTLRQRLAAPGALTPRHLDLRMETDPEAAAQDKMQAEMIRPFRLEAEAGARVLVLRLGERRWRVLLVVHHALCDGWSVGLLLRDLAALYAVETGAAAAPSAPARQFEDFAAWQQGLVASPDGRALLARSVARLTPPPAPLDLPSDRRRPAVRSFRGGTVTHVFEAACGARLDALAQNAAVTPFALAAALVQVLLHRLTGAQDLALGTLVAAREQPELRDTVGFFVNTLVLRQTLDSASPFRRHLEQTQALCLEAIADQHCPFEAVVDAVAAPRDLARNPLFDVLVVWQEEPAASPTLPGLTTAIAPIEFPLAKFDLSFHFGRRDGRIACQIEFSADLFDAATVLRLGQRLERLAEAVLLDPDQPVRGLDILPLEERALVLERFNETRTALDIERTIPMPFLDRLAMAPSAPALLSDDGPALDYRGFAGQAGALAHRLVDAGVRPGDVVALCMPRSPGMLVAIHGILLSGAAYAPLGPEQPAARIADMLDDLGRPLVLATAATRALVEGGTDRLILLGGAAIPAQSGPLPCPAAPDGLAYVLFTSGSTGRPKGVEIEHRAVLNRILWMQRTFPIGPGDVVLQKTPVTFDVSVWELFWWSWTGAAVAVPPPGLERDPPALAAFVERHQVTVMHFVPSMLAAFLACIEDGRIDARQLRRLRMVFASGEALKPDLVARFDRQLHRPNGTELHNLYGPTEATVDVAWQPCSPWRDGETVPIGRPIANTRLYVLDGEGRPQPIGVPGEIHIGGVQVARGYRNRPELTRERFLPDPFTAGGRLYRTGDLGRWRPDGAVDYLGRLDHQVKVRGQRIEPGEIEHALEGHPSIERAIVVPALNQGLTELHAYLLARGPLAPDLLTAHLAGRLPEAMMPARFFRLDSLPLTSNGKIDRKALAGTPILPGAPVPAPVDHAPAPEREIRAIWQTLLPGIEPGPRDGFFALGGNSLLVIRLHQKLEARWPGIFSIADLFACATIAEQARRVAGAAAPPAAPAAPTLPTAGTSGAIAIVGLAVRLPGGETLDAFWHDVAAGADHVRPLPSAREAEARMLYAALGLPAPVRFREGAYLDDVMGFDPRRFRMSPADAALIDPEQRLFLDVALRALENAGRGGSGLDDARVGVFVGGSGTGSWRLALMRGVAPDRVEQAFALNVPSNVATRLSFLHNWRGPAVLADTACSASLTAVHLACRALRAGECDWALVGGAKTILLPPGDGQRLSIDSATGRTRAFSADADGTGMGEGAIALLLRPLDAALAARDPIHAVILGSAVNQDGASSGMAAPNPVAQAEVIRAAADDGGISLASLSYVEAHGTGTSLGDPIEIDGLTRAFAPDTAETGFALIGAGKGNYGHLDGAAGVLGLARAVLCLIHDQAPPQPFFTAPNPKIAFVRAPVAVARQHQPLPDRGGPRRAGVSAFSLSGVNAHVVLEAAPVRTPEAPSGDWVAIGLSAADPEALRLYADAMVSALRARPDWGLHEIARSLIEGREALPARFAVAVRDRGDLMARLAVYVVAPDRLGGLAETGLAGANSTASTNAAGLSETAALAAARGFVAGERLVWPEVYGHTGRVHLPSAPLTRRRLVPDFPAAAEASPVRGLLGAPARAAEGTFHPLDVHAPDFWPVAEHRLDGEPTLVGMAFPALLAAATGGGPVHLRDLRWLRPLRPASLVPGSVTLAVTQAGRASLTGRTLGGEWVNFAEAQVSSGVEEVPALDLSVITARCKAPVPAGPPPQDGPVTVSERWHCLTRIAEGGGERLAWGRSSGATGLPLDPALLDVMASLALREPGLIPAGCAEFLVCGRMPVDPVAHVRTRPIPEGIEAEVLLAEAADGRIAVVCRGLRFVRRTAPGMSAPARAADFMPTVPVWRSQVNGAADPGARVLVLGEGPLADRLASHLAGIDRLAGRLGTAGIDAGALDAIVADAPIDIILAPDEGPDLADRVVAAVHAVLSSLRRPTRLLGLAHGAFAVDEATAVDPIHAVTFGAVLTAGLEEPMLTARYVDTDAATPPADLLAEFAALEETFRALAWRDGNRLARHFVPIERTPDSIPAMSWPDHGVCVVSGGTGGLALLLAESLAAGGRVVLALLSRRGMPVGEDAEAAARRTRLAALEAAGVRIEHHACDVTDRASLAATLKVIRARSGPITAIVHNAGLSEGGFLIKSAQSVEFGRELAAKLTGTRLLHELTRDDPLQAFVMAGSLTGLLGSAGFAAYTAGNAFEDGFAHFRRRQGRPALTIDWCRIGEMGMAAREGAGRTVELAMGGTDIAAIWRRALGAGAAQVAVLDPATGPRLMGKPALRPAETSRAGLRPGGILEVGIAAVWAEVLGYDTVAADDDFYALGGDSIAGMRIVERIVRDLGHPMTLADLLETGTVAALAGRLRERSKTDIPSSRSVMRAPAAAYYPVAWEQLAVLNAEAVAEMGTAYNLPHGLPLPPDIVPDRLAAALGALIERHEILRTRFIAAAEDGGEPVMEVLAAGPATIEHLEAADESQAERAMIQWVRPFELFSGVPVRFARLDVAGRPNRLLLDVHHALADAFSLEVLLADLAALLADRAGAGPDLQLKDYAWWSRRGGAASDAAARAYWLERFSTQPPLLDLPADRPRPAQPSRRIDAIEFTVPSGTVERLRATAAARRATPFALVTAAWSVLLRRYARIDDLVLAVPVDSREADGLAGMVGMMVSLLPLRLSAVDGESVADLVDRVQATCAQALRHRAFGLGRLLGELALPAVPGRAPLADVTLSYMNFAAGGGGAVDAGGLAPFGLPRTEGKSDLGLYVRDLPDRMIVACEYATDLYDRSRIERMARHFRTLLAALADARPDQPVDGLSLLDAEEAAWIAAAERGPAPPLTLERGLFGSFVDRVKAQPDARALTGPDGTLGYGELLRRASGVATALTAAGVAPGDRVALHVERDARAIVLLMGIVAAGAVYVPLDPAYPAERVAWLLEDSACRLAIADAAGRTRLDGRVPLLAAETLGEATAEAVPQPPADGPAYLLYTSGSTGRPKGVLVPQRAVLRLAQGDDYARIGPADRVMQTGPLAFDASTFEIWGALLNGAELCIATREELLDPVQLGAAFARHRASVTWLAAGLFNRQADAAPDSFRGLRAVLVGGEALSPPHLRRAMRANPDVAFFNAYGPTENTTFSTIHRIVPDDVATGPVPIGRPIGHTRVVILEGTGLRAPIGIWGEIALGGLGLADGYLGRPDLTAEKFAEDRAAPSERLYRTGDLGRWRADGTIEFGGRRDAQIKLRGFRIELEEIELALIAHAGVADAVLLHRPGADGGELVACIRPAVAPPPGAEVLRAWLGERLPAYMVPRRFVPVEALPITPNGKVDRVRLAALLPAEMDEAAVGEAPRAGTERAIADVLGALFNRPVEDRAIGFLALGGHSLLAIRVVNRIAEATGVRLTMRDFFAADTVMALAALVDRSTGIEAPILPAVPAEHYPASHAQARLYLAHRLDSDSGAYNIAFALPAGIDLDTTALAEALRRLSASHEPLRTGLLELDGQIRQRIAAEAPPPVALADVSAEADPRAEALRLARREAVVPFDLAQPPLLRARAIRLGAEGWLVLLVLHHAVGDGWSSRILLRELAQHYGDAVAGRALVPPTRSIAYRDFAVWQAGRDWRASAAYWRRTLDGAPGAITLPTDRPPPLIQSHRGDTVTRILPPAIAEGLAGYARHCDATMATVGLALFAGLLYRLGRQRDLVIGLGVAGRDRAALEGLIGFFVNVLPIRLRLDDETAFEDLVAQAQGALLGAMDHRDYPFDLLVRAVAPKRSANRQPLVNVVFEYQRFEDLGADLTTGETPVLGDAALDPGFLHEIETAIRPATAKHDLLLFLTERRDRSAFLLEFDTDVIDRTTAERWLAYLEQFATMIVSKQSREAAE